MESLNLLKFWRKSVSANNVAVAVADVISTIDYVNNRVPSETDDYYSDDDDDSFFELELNAKDQGDTLVESPRDVFRNGRVFPLDSTPQSPISAKSGAKFKLSVVWFRKSTMDTTGNTLEKSHADSSSVQIGQSKRFFNKTNGEETPVLSRDNSLRSKLLRESFDDSAKRSESLRSKLLKPLYSMASKRYNADSPVVSPMVSPVSSPRRKTSGLKNAYKSIGKSKSMVSNITASSPVNRRDDCLLHDGIQGAILHCNRSFNSPAKGTTSQQSELTKRSSI